LKQRLLKSLAGRVGIGFERKLHIRVAFRRYHRDPAVFANGDVFARHEAQHFGIELERLVLVVDQHAVEFDFHGADDGIQQRTGLLKCCAIQASRS
jgi:hypothetical protein